MEKTWVQIYYIRIPKKIISSKFFIIDQNILLTEITIILLNNESFCNMFNC